MKSQVLKTMLSGGIVAVMALSPLPLAPSASAEMYVGNYNLIIPDRRDFHTWIISLIAACRTPENVKQRDCITAILNPQPVAKAEYTHANA